MVVSMSLAILVCLVAIGVGFIDWVYLRRTSKRALWLEFLGFATILILSLRPAGFTAFANALGIGRGVDMIIYPLLVWLFREAILGRIRFYRQRQELTRLIRQLAVDSRIIIAP